MRRVHIFRGPVRSKLKGFTEDETGANLPADKGPWLTTIWKSILVDPNNPSVRIGVDDQAILDGLVVQGYYITTATIQISETENADAPM